MKLTAAAKLALLTSSLSAEEIAQVLKRGASTGRFDAASLAAEEKDTSSSGRHAHAGSSHRSHFDVDSQASDVRFYNNAHFDGGRTGSVQREVAQMAALYPNIKAAPVNGARPPERSRWTSEREYGDQRAHAHEAAFDAETSFEIEENQS